MQRGILFMFESKNLIHILTILEAIEKISLYSAEFKDEDEFFHANKQLNFNAVVNLLIAIGEENKKIEESLKKTQNFNWKALSAMRDKMSHNYRGVDESIVWDIIQNYLPPLKATLLLLLPKVSKYRHYIAEAINTEFYEDLKYLQALFIED